MSFWKTTKKSMRLFNWPLYTTLIMRLVLPNVYQTFRVSILGKVGQHGALSIASQLVWVHVLLKTVEEALLQPLYHCLGKTIGNQMSTRNKVKTGVFISGCIHILLTSATIILSDSLVNVMALEAGKHCQTIEYIRLELVASVANTVTRFLLVVMVMQEWNAMVFFLLAVQMVSSVCLDWLFIGWWGVIGIAWSSIVSGFLVLCVAMTITWHKLGFGKPDIWVTWDYSWISLWSQVGIYSGLESFVRNVVYLLVILRPMNLVNEQDSFWVTNTFIWNWMLMPVLPLAELLTQAIARDQKDVRKKLWSHVIIVSGIVVLWFTSYPGWSWFITTVLCASKPDLVLGLATQLMPCYVAFAYGQLMIAIFCALGATKILFFKTVACNMVIVIIYSFYASGIISTNIFSIAALMGFALVLGGLVSFCVAYCLVLSK